MTTTAEKQLKARNQLWHDLTENQGKSWQEASVLVDAQRYTDELLRWRIDGVGVDTSDPDVPIPYLIVSKRGKKKVVFISADPEFNSAGHLEIDADALKEPKDG